VSQSAVVPITKQICLQQPFKLSETVTMPYRWIGSVFHRRGPAAAKKTAKTTNYDIAYVYVLACSGLNGSSLVSINEVTLRQARLVLGWVTVCGRVIATSVCNQPLRSTQPPTHSGTENE